MTAPDQSFSDPGPARGWTLAALLIFLVGIASFQYPTWSAGFTSHVGFPQAPGATKRNVFIANDQLFVVGLTGRNARTLLTKPLDFYEAEHCFPGTQTLAYGEPMVVLSLAAVPAYALTQSLAAAYNFGVLLLILLSAMAMYWLVRDWTGIPAAGIVAGLLYGFESNRIEDLVHLYIYDGTWTVLALFFARKWFADGRWRDALGLAVVTALQFGAAFYPVLAAVCISLPFTIWLAIHYGFSKIRWTQVAVIAGVAGLAAAAVYGPYIALAGSSGMPARTFQLFAQLSHYSPGEYLFPGWFCLALVSIGLFLGGRAGLPVGARISLVAGALMVIWLAAGPHVAVLGLPNLYESLGFLPGLQSIRVPGKIAPAVNLGLCILAGCGAAVLLRQLRGWTFALASGALILASGAVVLAAAAFSVERPLNYEPRRVEATPEEFEFFETLEQMGNRGPLLELPLVAPGLVEMVQRGQRTYRAMFHGRRTSACVGSYHPPETRLLNQMSMDNFDTQLVERISAMGFTTILVHRPPRSPRRPPLLTQLRNASKTRGSGIRFLHENKWMVAFELVPVGDPSNVGRASKQVLDQP